MKTFSESSKKIHQLEKQVLELQSELEEAQEDLKITDSYTQELQETVKHLHNILKTLLESDLLNEVLTERGLPKENQTFLNGLKRVVKKLCVGQLQTLAGLNRHQ